MHNRHVLILTNCTNRKRGLIRRQLLARSLPKGTYAQVSAEWVRRLDDASEHYVAEQLYCGRAVTETLSAARAISAEVVFLSAGLGVVPQAERVPSYNLTSSPGLQDSIGNRISETYSAARWWKTLGIARGKENALARLTRDRKPILVLAVLPASYLRMVGYELLNLPPHVRRSLRIIGPRRAAEVPDGLQSHWLPYDWRLDSPKTGFNGTTTDFPHRALRHFVTELPDRIMRLSATQHRQLVDRALSGFEPYVQKCGARASDEELLAVIRRLWDKCGGNRSAILCELRAHMGLACEQSRFRRLADRLEGKM